MMKTRPKVRVNFLSRCLQEALFTFTSFSLFFFYITYYPKCIAGGMLALAPQYTINGRYHSVDIAARGLESR